jgi:transcriptional regulator of acetoin/glycerol metabolism
VAWLLDEFLASGVEGTGAPLPRLSAAVRRHLLMWPWPGNVRELKNVASWLAAMSRDEPLQLSDLPERLRAPMTRPPGPWAPELRLDLNYMDARRLFLDEFQSRYVLAQLEAHGGNVSEASRAAGMDRRSIQRILSRLRGRVVSEGE